MFGVLADTSFPEGLGSWTRLTFQASGSLQAYGTMFALARLAGRLRRGRSRG
jgi:hypothetical protein